MKAPRRRPRLTLDIAPMLEDQWTGIPVFTARLAKALLRHGGLDLGFCCNLALVPPERVLATLRHGTGTFLREEVERDVFAELGLVDPDAALLFPSVKTAFGVVAREASTVHDMSTLFMPENHVPANVAHHLDPLREELATDEVVFCVSEASRQALIAACPAVEPKTRVLYQYVDWPETFEAMDRNAPSLALGRYAVVIGTLEPRKNLGLLFRALALPEVRRSDVRFVVIGRKGWKVDALLEGLSEEIRSRVIFTGFVSEFIKYRLLRGCEFLVYPSVYEGFGIPAVEAMSLGKPVLAAMTSSFPEVIGEAGVFFDPFDLADFSAGLERITALAREREIAERAMSASRAFNWQRMAEAVVQWV